jgi:cyclopropane fatty-acyl-phospholipid synthase-like methyltransferase
MKRLYGEQAQPGFSEACERNKDVILDVLKTELADATHVLEVGSGTGQHIAHFAQHMPELQWQPADQSEYLPALSARLEAEALDNISEAVELDVRMTPWPLGQHDAVFSANTLHYMSKKCVEAFFCGVAEVLPAGGVLVIYGPFNYAGQYTSESNARFDQWLKSSDPDRAIRDFEWVNDLAALQQFELQQDINMPANNRSLVWRRKTVL